MLDQTTKQKLDSARQILVGKVPDPKAQVEQITTALIYKFMDDMDKENEEVGLKTQFFVDDWKKFSWTKILDNKLSGQDRLDLYVQAITNMPKNPHIPQLFRNIFKGAFLPYNDPRTLSLFLKEINEFNYEHSENLGNAFEYLLSILGSQGDAGQFRTPRHIIDFIVEVVDPKKDETILDPACGTAGFLISAYKHILKQNKEKALTPDEKLKLMNNLAGYDISPDMVKLALVNMYLHGFPEPKIHEYDSLTSEKRWDETFDVILANPPFMTPKGGIVPHKRFSIQANRAEVLFVDYIVEHLTIKGRAGIIVPEGINFQNGKAYKNLRKLLVDKGLYAVISLPSGVFQPYSGVITSLLFIDSEISKKNDEILFIKVQNEGYDLGAQRKIIDKNDLPVAKEILKQWKINKTIINPSIAHAVKKDIILQSDDCILSGDRHKETDNSGNKKWPLLEINKLVKFFNDGNWIESKDQSPSGIRLIQTGNIGIGEYLDKSTKSRFISEETFGRLNCIEIFPGDILISRLPDPVGRACIIPDINYRMITAVDCTIIRFDEEKILPKYFLYFSKSGQYFNELTKYLTGASRKRISRSNLAKIKIPVPPLDIQRKIIKQIEVKEEENEKARMMIEKNNEEIENILLDNI